ncbi:hypothetical protein AV530_007025 [Patagioenas fasciata monilis]|uniref:Mos1 transposase HTH domain-containing protein n=1 Tax=Patagioenas fasciata monilis TaxID=372326 RepID=A0A1V4L1N4_PATFA|nr:hypothetical protein AV530_007025 [Patagioenas fasciata monilis]
MVGKMKNGTSPFFSTEDISCLVAMALQFLERSCITRMLILTMQMMLDKKQIRAIFLFEFKRGCKAVETTLNINNTFGPGTASKRTAQWWFKKFHKGDKNLEDEERSGRLSEVDNHQLRAIIEANPLATTQEVAEELNVDHSRVIWHLKLIGKVKKLNKWVPHKLNENPKNCHFEVSSYSTQQR